MSTTFKKIAFGSAAAFVTAAAALTPAQEANAAALKGSFFFDAQDGDPGTTAILTTSEVDFKPDNNAHIDLKEQSGSFVGIENALISDIPVLPHVGDPLVDEFLVFDDNQGGEAKFSITEVFDYVFTESSLSTTITLDVKGFFTSSTGDISKGIASFSFINTGKDLDTVLNEMENGGLTSSFNGASLATVPEPATMAGLSLVAVGMALAGRRKKA